MRRNPLLKIGAFAAALVVVFAASYAVGDAADVSAPAADQEGGHGDGRMAQRSEGAGHGADHGAPAGAEGSAGLGLAVASAEPLRFRVESPDGEAVRDFDVVHTKRMHAIVVRDDLSEFQHLHPRLAADGSWETPLRVPSSGPYTLFADFSVAGEATTLAAALPGTGTAPRRPLPPPRSSARDDGYEVRLAAVEPRPGEEAVLRFTVSRDGRPAELRPYLGAGGHLVALREGDLEYLHVHPLESGEDAAPKAASQGGHGHGAHSHGGAGQGGEGQGGEAASGEGAIAFATSFPSAGRYRLFLQFKAGGAVRTVAFTKEVR